MRISCRLPPRAHYAVLIECSKSLLKGLGKHAEDHYPNSSYGVYPIEDDSKIAIVLVANKYSPNNFWYAHLFIPSLTS